MRLDDMLRPKGEEKGQESAPNPPGERPDALPHSGSPQAGDPANNQAGNMAVKGETERSAVGRGQTVDVSTVGLQTTELSAKPAVSLTAKVASPSLARNADFKSLRWHSSAPTQAKRPVWEAMPTFNRFLAVFGGACLALALARMVIPPLAESAEQAYRPYTTAGKQEICATHLRSIAQALAAYSQDNDGRYPPLDYQDPQGKRATWVSQVKGRTAADDLTCPVGPNLSGGTETLTSSFVLNPVTATARASEMDDASATLLLADGGTKHDVSLLPPYPSWPSYGKRGAEGTFDAAESNFDFRHAGQADVVYADGHAGTLSTGTGVTEAAVWGGSAVLRRARSRLSQGSPEAGELFKRLQADDVSGAASYLTAHRAPLKTVSGDLLALWRINTGEHTSDSVEKLGWNLAQAWEKAGDDSFEKQCGEEQTRRSQAEAQNVSGGSWEQRQVTGQPSMRCEAPSAWKYQDEQDGRYRRLYLRSSSPALYALLEVGNRTKYVTPQPIIWDGEEKEFQRRYKGNYHRLSRGMVTLSGQQASVWEYEVEKPGLPRLHKRVLGYTDGWTSYVASYSAPAKDWNLWKPVFDKLSGTVSTG